MLSHKHIHLTAKAPHTRLSHHAEELWLAWVLMAQIANACLTVHTHEAWVGCR